MVTLPGEKGDTLTVLILSCPAPGAAHPPDCHCEAFLEEAVRNTGAGSAGVESCHAGKPGLLGQG